ncbi:putative trans-sialidase [Trypanosoma cruzi]|nr:putative trans-sialidase [Trypanosoma cruzi]
MLGVQRCVFIPADNKTLFLFLLLPARLAIQCHLSAKKCGRATTKVSCYEATAIERTFRGEGPVQCPAVGAQPRCLDILEADGARFPARQLACLWRLADPAAAEIASWHCCFDVD